GWPARLEQQWRGTQQRQPERTRRCPARGSQGRAGRLPAPLRRPAMSLRPLLVITLGCLLAACQSVQVERDFDPSRDFAAYRSWSWQEPALSYSPDDPRLKSDLTEQRIRAATGEQLEQRGLRPAASGV